MPELQLQPGQAQNLEMGLRMSPQLQQSLRLLQSSKLELAQLLRAELEQNPVLEMEEDHQSLEELGMDDDRALEGEAPEEEAMVDSYLDDLREESILSSRAQSQNPEAERLREAMFEAQSTQESLQQHLVSQLGLVDATNEVLSMMRLLIEQLDEQGFFHEDLEDLALRLRLPYAPLKEALKLLQNLEPAGIGGRDLRECLTLQAKRKPQADQIAINILEQHFELLARNRRQQLAKELRVPLERINQAIDWIRALDPHPARQWATQRNHQVSADAIITPSTQGWEVEMPQDGLPKLRLNPWYKDLLGTSDKETRTWLKGKLRDGNFVIRSLAQRQETLKRVIEEILQRQPDLPQLGLEVLKPMTMAQVAEKLDLHEATVSRAVAGKYMETPAGLIELRRLFSTKLSGNEASQESTNLSSQSPENSNTSPTPTSSEGVSGERARQLISQFIAKENRRKPLSDQKLVHLLAEQGVPIARRTVTKYREKLGIAPSNLRRE